MSSRRKLSKNLFQMKFMKRSREKVEKEELEEERKAFFENEVTDTMRKAGSKYLIESSYIACDGLRFGRMSFHGFNPEIEKIMKFGKDNSKHNKTTTQSSNEGMSNEEFAERYSTLVGTMKKKFGKKRSRTEAKEEINEHKKQKVEEKEQFKKPKVSIQVTEQGEDVLKAQYPRRKRAAEFWKPDDD